MKRLTVKCMSLVNPQSRHDEEGAVAAEYGVLLAGVVALVAVAAAALGGRIGDLFNTILP
jgi:Flp pilus assembly pilin Flp